MSREFQKFVTPRDDRRFQLWRHSVSHSSLLLRSTRNDPPSTRIDILFKGVRALCLPTLFTGIRVDIADAELQQRITDDTGVGAEYDNIFYRVSYEGYSGYVVALAVFEVEDDGMYFDPSPLWPENIPSL